MVCSLNLHIKLNKKRLWEYFYSSLMHSHTHTHIQLYLILIIIQKWKFNNRMENIWSFNGDFSLVQHVVDVKFHCSDFIYENYSLSISFLLYLFFHIWNGCVWRTYFYSENDMNFWKRQKKNFLHLQHQQQQYEKQKNRSIKKTAMNHENIRRVKRNDDNRLTTEKEKWVGKWKTNFTARKVIRVLSWMIVHLIN
jgi:hypothetical protein